MSGEWGYTVPPSEGQGDVMTAIAEADKPPSTRLPPGQWVKKNLFNTWYNSIVTVVLGTVSLYLLYRFGRFVFVTGRWDPIETNLELFMIGQFPREERWRIIAQVILLGGAIGLSLGSIRASARDRAEENDVPYRPESWRTYASSYWAVALFVFVLLAAFTSTWGPTLIAVATVAAAVLGRAITVRLPRRLRTFGWTLAALAFVIEFQLLSGTGGWAWFYTTIAIAPFVASEIGYLFERVDRSLTWVFVAASAVVGVATVVVQRDTFSIIVALIGAYAVVTAVLGDRVDGARVGAVMLAGAAVFFIYRAIGLEGIDWSDWGGFHLNIIATVVAILLAFPLGLVLALGRRSDLPAIRVMSVGYIEFFRGAPLITFLLSAQFFLGFFLDTDNPLSLITRAIAAVTLFSAAYVAEIVRGGLQAVPKGQIEAGQAGGLSQIKIMRLIVLPQALRAVIPAMVGQFISLFKDTTLFVIITIPEFLAIREIVHAQPDFRGFGIGETLVFVAFGFWAVSFTMSRESQRLERRLGIGER